MYEDKQIIKNFRTTCSSIFICIMLQKSQNAKTLEELKKRAQEKKKNLKIDQPIPSETAINHNINIEATALNIERPLISQEIKDDHPNQIIDENTNRQLIASNSPQREIKTHSSNQDKVSFIQIRNDEVKEVEKIDKIQNPAQDHPLSLQQISNHSQDIQIPSKVEKKAQKIILKELAYVKLAIKNLQSALKGLQYIEQRAQQDSKIRDKIQNSLKEFRQINII